MTSLSAVGRLTNIVNRFKNVAIIFPPSCASTNTNRNNNFGKYKFHFRTFLSRPNPSNCTLCRCYEKTVKMSPCLVNFHTSSRFWKRDVEKELMIRSGYFENLEKKDKETFIEAINIFVSHGGQRRGHVEFIYAAMKYLKEFGVHRDLETYKKLLDVFPKGKYVSQTMWQVEFMHYPKQQQCAIDLLDEMEGNGVIPDIEMQDILFATFGMLSFPSRKYARMMYWMPKFKNLSPWPIPDPLPNDPMELAKIAIARISSVDLEAKMSVYETKKLNDAIDDTWIVSSQSVLQKKLLSEIKDKCPVYVEGSFLVCLKYCMVSYFILRSEPKPPPKLITDEELDDVSDIPLFVTEEKMEAAVTEVPSVHEQDDGVVLAVCATGTSSRDSVLSWIRFLQEENPRLSEIPVVFTLKSPSTDVVTIGEDENDESRKRWTPPVNQQPGLIS